MSKALSAPLLSLLAPSLLFLRVRLGCPHFTGEDTVVGHLSVIHIPDAPRSELPHSCWLSIYWGFLTFLICSAFV